MRNYYLIYLLAFLLLFTGCMGSLKRTKNLSEASKITLNTPLSDINVTTTESIKDKLYANATFKMALLKNNINSILRKANLKDAQSNYVLKVVVNDVRVRSTFNAVMWGFVAGDDHINGKVTIKDGAGNIANEFDVNASYSLGGLAGGNDGSRPTLPPKTTFF